MKHSLVLFLLALSSALYAQDKYNYVRFNSLIEVEGTEYSIASVQDQGKKFTTHARYLLFINTESGETRQVDFPKDAYIEKIEQVRIDSLSINRIVVFARTIDLNGKRGIDWEDPKQILILSADGKEKTQLTEDRFFVRTWTTNKKTGRIVIAGHYDTNSNDKADKNDKNEIRIYDLKTLRLIEHETDK